MKMQLKKQQLLIAALAIACFTNFGCNLPPEASFSLARESRMPKWVKLTPAQTSTSPSLTMA